MLTRHPLAGEPGFAETLDVAQNSVEEAMRAAYAMREAGLHAAALNRFRDAALAAPLRADCRAACADVLLDLGRLREAAEEFGAAALLDQDCLTWQICHAETLAHCNRRAEAAEIYERILQSRAGLGRIHAALAALRAQEGDHIQAQRHYREAVNIDARDSVSRRELALLIAEDGDLAEAVSLLQRNLREDRCDDSSLFHLGRLQLQMFERDKAADSLRRYLDLDPLDALGAATLLEKCAQAPEQLPEAYVRQLFDQYAENFDRNLTRDLRYCGHEIVGRCLSEFVDFPGDVLDMGCGTGLAGLVLRPMAVKLHGFDLAPNMVEKAVARGLYDKLWDGEALSTLEAMSSEWDIIAAADVLAYFGNLEPLFLAVRRALRPQGLFAATLERSEDHDFLLQETRRYAHSRSYIHALAQAVGLSVLKAEDAVSRHERGQPVPGLAIVLRRI